MKIRNSHSIPLISLRCPATAIPLHLMGRTQAGWQTAALKANRKPLLWPWPWGAWLRSGLGPGVPVGEGVWRVWRVLEGLEGFGLEGFGGFGRFGGFWRVFGGFGRFWRVWRVWRVLEGVWRVWRILERLEGFGGFGVFAGWQTAALKAHRKPLLWPWPWGACSGSGLGPGVPAGDGVWRVWKVLEGLEGFGSLERLQAGKRQL